MDLTAIIVATIAAIASMAAIIAPIIKSRGDNRLAEQNAKTTLDRQIDERIEKQLKDAWTRIDSLETEFKELQTTQSRRDGAMTRILKALAAQWPDPHGPKLDPADIAIIEETVPAQWIRRPEPEGT